MSHKERFFYLSVLGSYLNSPQVQQRDRETHEELMASEQLRHQCRFIFPVLVVDPVPTKCVFYSLDHFRIDLGVCGAPGSIHKLIDLVEADRDMQLGILTFVPPYGLRQFVIGAYRYDYQNGSKVYELVAGAGMSRLDIPIDFDTSSKDAQWSGYIPSRQHEELFKACCVM